uniref:Fatty acid hydroxylase domain-containing protein n=1 Tax=Heterorhabditis bacteriophora TaxID=37862 RepID=A0A1I7XDK6_HETBA
MSSLVVGSRESFVDGKWVFVDDEVLRAHPGGSAITTYRNKEASTIFHTFHAGSKRAYQWLHELKEKCPTQNPDIKEEKEEMLPGYEDVNMGSFDIPVEKAAEIAKNFDHMRIQVRRQGLMEGSALFYLRKVCEKCIIICIFFKTLSTLIFPSFFNIIAVNHFIHLYIFCNEISFITNIECLFTVLYKLILIEIFYSSYFVGNFLQGFSSGGWKEQHNIHHAATNVVGRDGDLDLMPFWATVVQDLKV